MIAMLMMTTAGAAQDAMPLEEQVLRCFNPPPAIDDYPPVDFDVVFDETGSVADIAVAKHDREKDRELVMSAARAIEQCSPYEGVGAGVLRVTIAVAQPEPIDPYKSLSE